MALVNITNVIVLDNPSVFSNDFQFEIEFECLGELEDDLEWKVTYVGSAEDQTRDQVLEEVMVGPVPQGVSKLVLTAEAPSTALILSKDLVGVTVVLITCSYREKEFVRIGYYVNNEYYHTNPLVAPPPPPPQVAGMEVGTEGAVAGPQPVGDEELAAMLAEGRTIDPANVYRNIMSEQPRVTRFQIDWTPQQQQRPDQQAAMQQDMQQQMQQDMQKMAQAQASGGLPAPPLQDSGMDMGAYAQQVTAPYSGIGL